MRWVYRVGWLMLLVNTLLLMQMLLRNERLEEEIEVFKANEQPDVRALVRTTTEVNERTLKLMDTLERGCR